MVHALEKAHGLLTPEGRMIDIHPTPELAVLEVNIGGSAIAAGVLRETDDGVEYQRADAALDEIVNRRLFLVEGRREFRFVRYAPTVREMTQHLSDTWEDAYLEEETIATAERLMGDPRAEEVVLREQVVMTRLKRLSGPAQAPSRDDRRLP